MPTGCDTHRRTPPSSGTHSVQALWRSTKASVRADTTGRHAALVDMPSLVPTHRACTAVLRMSSDECCRKSRRWIALIPVTEQILLTISEAAERLRIGRSTTYELIAAGRLETVHIGRACRV